MKKWIALLLALAMMFSLAACGEKDTGDKQDEQPAVSEDVQQPEDTQTPEPSTEPTPELNNEVVEYYMQKANEVQVTDTHVIFTDDGSGQELSIEKNPQNVAVMASSLVCLWYEAGGTVPLMAGGKSAIALFEEQIGRDVTKDEGVKVVAESSSASNWDIEAILAEKPDLIVTSLGMKGYATISDPAAAMGIPVIGINYSNVQDYLKWYKVFCNLSGHPELWEEVAEKTANDIIDIVSRVPKEEEAPTAAILVIYSDTLRGYTGASQSGEILRELGAVNVFDPEGTAEKSNIDISLEDLYAQDPDYLFLCWYGEEGEMYNKLMEMVEGNPVWDSLRAVKEDRFYQLERGLFYNKANKRYNEAYQTMAQFLYPDVF